VGMRHSRQREGVLTDLMHWVVLALLRGRRLSVAVGWRELQTRRCFTSVPTASIVF
jgi:hypothetical protein